MSKRAGLSGIRMIAVTMSISSIASAAQAEDEIRFGLFTVAPFMYTDKDSVIRGPISSVIDDFGKFANTKVTKEFLPLNRVLVDLSEGRLDIMPSCIPLPPWDQKFYFSDPFQSSISGIVVKKDHKLNSVTSANDLVGLKIGMVDVANALPIIKENRAKLTIEIMPGENNMFQKNLDKMLMGRLDAFIDVNMQVSEFETNRAGHHGKFKFLPLPNSEAPVCFCAPRTERGKKLMDLTNRFLKEKYKRAAYYELVNKEIQAAIPK